MARRAITTPAPAKVATAYDRDGNVLGAIEDSTVAPALSRPVAIPGALANGTIPLTVAFPPGATSVVLWDPRSRLLRPLVAGVNSLRPSDLGQPDATPSRAGVFIAAFGAAGATSFWFPLRLIWDDPPELPPDEEPVTLTSAGVMNTSGQVGGAITLTSNAVWGGSVRSTDSWIETSPNNNGTNLTNAGDLTVVPNSVGAYFRAVWVAYGPDENGVETEHYNRSAWVQIAAATASRILADDVTFETSFYRPGAQSVTFAPLFEVDGGHSDMQFSVDLTNWYSVIASSSQLTTTNNTAGQFSTGQAKLKTFYLRHRPNSGVAYSAASPALTVPDAITPTQALYNQMRPSDTAIRSALQANLVPYAVNKPTNSGGGNAGINDRKWDQIVWVMASLAGVNTTFNGIGNNRNPRAFAISQLKSWLSDTGTTAPPMRSGYHGQHEMRAVCFIAMCRLDPNIWGALTVREQDRARWLMEAAGVSNVWIASTLARGFYSGGFGSSTGQRSLPGWTAGNNNVPNFSSPPRLTPHVVRAFMAYDTGIVTAFEDFLADYNREDFWEKGEELGGMIEARRVFSRRWTVADQTAVYGTASALGAGPTDAQVEAACHADPVRLVGEGGPFTLAQARQAFAGELTRVFSLPVRPGLLNAQRGTSGILGSNTVAAPYNNTAQKYGITMLTQTQNRLRACHGVPTNDRGDTNATGTGDTIYESIWLNLPDKGATGMYMEFDTTDGGESGGPNRRSAPTYGASGLGAIMDALVVMIYYQVIDADDTLFDTAKQRWRVGIRHFNYAAKYGYMGYAKGGFPSDNNVDWSPKYVARMFSWPAFMGMMDQVAEFWGFPSFPTDD